MEPPLYPARGRPLGKVLFRKLAHRGDKRRNRPDVLERVTVGLAFVESRERIQRRH